MNKLLTSTLISIGLAAAVPFAMAQTPAPGANAPQRHHMQRDHEGKRPFSLPSERVEARLAYLKTALKITDAQRSQWDAFAGVQRKHAKSADERIQARRAKMAQQSKDAKPTAIDRLERRQQMLAVQSQHLSELLAVEKPLYAALSPEQKQIADRVLASRGGHGKSHRGGMREHA